jgi:hypothetical protein
MSIYATLIITSRGNLAQPASDKRPLSSLLLAILGFPFRIWASGMRLLLYLDVFNAQ